MEKIKKRIRFKSGSTYSFNFCLYNMSNLLGEYTPIDQNSPNTNNTFVSNTIVTITAETSSKLSEVRTYDDNNPFIVGQNGVTNLEYSGNTLIKVEYTLNGIDYTTNILNNTTTYSFQTKGLDSSNSDNLPIIKNDRILDVSLKKDSLNLINVERQTQSAIENHYRISQIKNINDLTTYASGNYFNIF